MNKRIKYLKIMIKRKRIIWKIQPKTHTHTHTHITIPTKPGHTQPPIPQHINSYPPPAIEGKTEGKIKLYLHFISAFFPWL